MGTRPSRCGAATTPPPAPKGYSDADIVAMLADHGLAVAELDPAWWWTPGAASFSIPPELDPIDVFRFDEARALPHRRAGRGAVAQRRRCARGQHGASTRPRLPSPRCATVPRSTACSSILEWLAWSRIPDLATAPGMVVAGRPRQWRPEHRYRGTAPARERTASRPAAVPGERVLAVQIDDGPAERRRRPRGGDVAPIACSRATVISTSSATSMPSANRCRRADRRGGVLRRPPCARCEGSSEKAADGHPSSCGCCRSARPTRR